MRNINPFLIRVGGKPVAASFGVAGVINRSHLVHHPWHKRLWAWLRRKPLQPVRVIDDFTLDSFSLVASEFGHPVELSARPVPAADNAWPLELRKK